MSSSFVHLHVHTEFSLLDGAARIDSLVMRAKEQGMDALAITDHGAMYGVVDFFKACRHHGIKPIIGCEVYLAQRTRFDREPKKDDEPYHLVLLAENRTGYQNLLKLVSQGYLDGFYYKPRIDMDLLRAHNEGLIALSGCLAGKICRLIERGDNKAAQDSLHSFIDIFGQNHFFLELQDQGLREQPDINRVLVAMANDAGCQVVATNDVHYVDRHDAEAHDVLLCIQTGKKTSEEERMRLPTDQFYLKSPEEMKEVFSWCPEAIDTTGEIADRCNVEIELSGNCLPQFPIPKGKSAFEHLRDLCLQALPERYDEVTDQIQNRLDYELDMIDNMGFADYFLIVWDFVRYAREKNIPIGPGRGSVAGSIVAYVLGITNVEPLEYGLLFERFLNPERVTMPDMDIDFCFERRGEVIDYVVRQYGEEAVAQIITFGTMAARAAIRDVGRALDMPYVQVDKIAKMVPGQIGMTLEKAVETSSDLVEEMEKDPDVEKLITLARALEGLPRHASVHAAGVVIADKPLMEYVPLQKTSDDSVVTQFAMETLEELGLLKMDFLALRTLTVIDDCLQRIKAECGEDIDIDSIGLTDEKTYDMLSCGEAQGVFQLESDFVRQVLTDIKPDRFEEIIAISALCRPGPMEHIPAYVKNKSKGAQYLHPELESILAETHGIMIYQEQVMQVASRLGGFSLGQADILRRAMGKKKPELIQSMKQEFVQGAVERGIEEEKAKEIFQLIDRFAGYGFNKSHATAYSLIAYQTAYLKANYKHQFMAALLTSIMGSSDKVAQYIDACRKMDVNVLPPDINISLNTFTVAGSDIRFGLSAVKNVGENTIVAIIEARKDGEYQSLRDFCERVDNRHLNRRALESLIKAGAFDSIDENRAALLARARQTLEASAAAHKQRAQGQLALFDSGGIVEQEIEVDIEPMSPAEILAVEKEVLGLYISGHPLGQRERELKLITDCAVDEVADKRDGSTVVIGGVVSLVKTHITKQGEPMAFVTINDAAGSSVEAVMMPDVYKECSAWLETDQVCVIRGKVNSRDDDKKIRAEDVWQAEPGNSLILTINDELDIETTVRRIRKIIADHKGGLPVYIQVSGDDRRVLLPPALWVSSSSEMIEQLTTLLGSECVEEE